MALILLVLILAILFGGLGFVLCARWWDLARSYQRSHPRVWW
jgi:hypothetical protein